MASWSKYSSDTSGFWIKTPETYAYAYKRIQGVDGIVASIRRQDNNCLMGKIAIARCLAECLLPVEEFHLKRATGRFYNCGKSLNRRKSLLGKTRPGDCQQICNAIAIDRDLLHKRKAHFIGMFVNSCFLRKIGSRKSLGKTVFRRGHAGIHCREVVLGLVETKSGNGNSAITHDLRKI